MCGGGGGEGGGGGGSLVTDETVMLSGHFLCFFHQAEYQ